MRRAWRLLSEAARELPPATAGHNLSACTSLLPARAPAAPNADAAAALRTHVTGGRGLAAAAAAVEPTGMSLSAICRQPSLNYWGEFEREFEVKLPSSKWWVGCDCCSLQRQRILLGSRPFFQPTSGLLCSPGG